MADTKKPPTAQATEGLKRRVVKSPKWPSITLVDALAKAKTIYHFEKKNPTTPEVLLGHIGFKSRTGPANRTLSALSQYGLLEKKGTQFHISDKAWRILILAEDSEERARYLREAALKPSIFRELIALYPESLPSDRTLSDHLILNKKFNENSVERFLKIFKAAIDIAKPYDDGYAPEGLGNDEEEEGEDDDPNGDEEMNKSPEVLKGRRETPPPPLKPFQKVNPGESVLAFKISRDSEARVIFSGPVTQEAIDKLAALLNLSKDAYPTKDELVRPLTAIWHNKGHDLPVTIIGELGSQGGRRFYAANETSTGIPEDELEFEGTQPIKES